MGVNYQMVDIDMAQFKKLIEDLNSSFSKDFKNFDSIALGNYYASDGSMGSVKGKDKLVSSWGKMIKNAVQQGTPNLVFKTNSQSSDGEYLVDLGVFSFTDNENNVQSQGKYLVVWKQENGEWKIYRDIGL